MITSNDFKTGMSIIVDGTIYQVIEFLHVKPGKGSAFVRTKLKNVITGSNMEKTFRAGEKVEQAILDKREMQFLYASGDEYTFMDSSTYDQLTMQKKDIGDDKTKYMKDNMTVFILKHGDAVIGIDLPPHVELKIVDTPPSEKGNTASGGGKPATLETGAVVMVPFFVENGTTIRVDTRTNEYLDRV